MTTTQTDIYSLPPEEVERAYLEYRRACYDIVYRTCAERGLFDLLTSPRTTEEFCRDFGVADNKQHVARLLLDALVKYGAVRRTDEEPARYVETRDSAARSDFDRELIHLATGRSSVEELMHSENYAGILDALSRPDNPVSATFDADHLPLWEEVLQAPFYRYSRVRAVAEVAAAGPRLLDLACGPGFGLLELAEQHAHSAQADLLGIEISPDFVASATQRTAEYERVHVTRGDLEQPLGFVRDDYFDGAMIVGAYHFLRDKEPIWRTVSRVLRPGGTFCIAYALSKVGSYDQEIMDLRFALRRPPSYQPTREEVLDAAGRHSMTLSSEFALGAWRWYSFTKDA
ncbi:class I SAM-dependent methyltransferase [Marinitenerispora sediminis]|uniref:Methyltransferase type 11 domain-containing protein n=1 Tax=Marinitenerispora sediminis TaxID=1931232 RepID=A0A368T9J6_9ACTN|nr:class I SAM-dependent methyltransferase [Marinitenerispora sediminis]RCV49011.1 hypothetical protein DEF28_22000 [Marinitenerispora sediminis]RCV51735.1 hypothetical protein DEF23_19945 [Marinitenerispora sediminis]RCV60959.1 hypothetical protein DEF24_05420 [Marinitenerispora sediminis]